MSIINLSKRTTNEFSNYSKYMKSSDSLIYLDEDAKFDDSGPDCLMLSVGECWYDKGRYVSIDPKKGIKIRPHQGVVIESKEHIAVPLNMYGVIFGAGSNIYKGVFISNGKIDPGYNGKLKIGYHNASDSIITIKRNDKLAYAIFLTSETNLDSITKASGIQAPAISTQTTKEKIIIWLKRNVYQSATVAIALASLIVSLLS